jgi:putative FmdB family regulatory protein
MPTYEYECKKCGHRFEEFQNITDPPLRRCPRCKGRVRRLIGTGAGIIFKGEGFYATDYRTRSYKEQARKDREKAMGDSAKKVTEKGESKTGNDSAKSKKETDS